MRFFAQRRAQNDKSRTTAQNDIPRDIGLLWESRRAATKATIEILRCAQDAGAVGLFVAEDVAHAADLGTDAAELLFDAFVAAVDVVDAVEDGFTFGDQRGQ